MEGLGNSARGMLNGNGVGLATKAASGDLEGDPDLGPRSEYVITNTVMFLEVSAPFG